MSCMHDDTSVPVTPSVKKPATSRGVSAVTLMRDKRNWPIWIVPVICAGVFAGQQLGFVPVEMWALSGDAMAQGRWWTLLTSMFLHAPDLVFGSVHIASNMWAYLTLAPLVCARFGPGWRGVVPFHLFYVACGLAGSVVFWAVHPTGEMQVVGASGAIYGVYAAMMRLDLFAERLKPVMSRTTLEAAWFFVWSNALVLVMFGGPMVLLQVLAGQGLNLSVPIAWEAHLGGFVAGYLLIGVMAGKGWIDNWKAGLYVVRTEERRGL